MNVIPTSDIPILDFTGEKYLEWKIGVTTYLTATGLQGTIEEGCTTTRQDKAKAIIFLRSHIHESLKCEFLLCDDPKELWENLSKRYGLKRRHLYRKACEAWCKLKFEDYESVSDYNRDFCRITSQLELHGKKYSEADKLLKTIATMQPQKESMREVFEACGYTSHSDLISVLLDFEQVTGDEEEEACWRSIQSIILLIISTGVSYFGL